VYSATWCDIDHTIILVSYSGRFSWQDYDGVSQETTRLLDECGGVVDLLVEFEVPLMAFDYSQRYAETSESSPFIHHPNAGHTVICGSNRMVGAMVGVFDRLLNPSRGHLHHATSIVADLAQLERYRIKAQLSRAGVAARPPIEP
jgi:hypothetical protein